MHQPVLQTPEQSTDASLQQAAGKSMYPAEHFVTAGEKRFDSRAYMGLGYIANVLLSLGAVYFIERMRPGQQTMNWLMKGADKMPNAISGAARFLASKTFFLTGGFAVLVPIKMMEDKKYEMVKKWNREIYGDRADTDQQILQSEQEIKEAPKQGWASILGSRVLSLIPFYLTVGLLWENKSKLGQITNKEFRGMEKEQRKAFLDNAETAIKNGDITKHSEFSQTMSKGVYFDRPIAWASRVIGKAVAKVTGNEKAVERITTMQKQFPGMIKEGVAGTTTRDPDHAAWPYYFISEAITSAIVARAVYLMTRVLGPMLGKKEEAPQTPAALHVSPEEVAQPANTTPQKGERPETSISAAQIDASRVTELAAAAAR